VTEPHVPAAVVRSVIEEAVARRGSLQACADATGVNPRALRAILSGESERVTFGMADRVVTGLAGAEIWHCDARLARAAAEALEALSPAATAAAQRILDAAARRLLGELDPDRLGQGLTLTDERR
jgi:hypothetical protein